MRERAHRPGDADAEALGVPRRRPADLHGARARSTARPRCSRSWSTTSRARLPGRQARRAAAARGGRRGDDRAIRAAEHRRRTSRSSSCPRRPAEDQAEGLQLRPAAGAAASTSSSTTPRTCPSRDQLKKAVVAFRHGGPTTSPACRPSSTTSTATRTCSRAGSRPSTRCGSTCCCPASTRCGAPIPLGGTSQPLPHATGCASSAPGTRSTSPRTPTSAPPAPARLPAAMLDSTTLRGGQLRPRNWIRQRSRWVKGYMQTWLVHMRHPFGSRELGFAARFSCSVSSAARRSRSAQPDLLGADDVWFARAAGVIERLFPGVVFYAARSACSSATSLFVYLIARRHPAARLLRPVSTRCSPSTGG